MKNPYITIDITYNNGAVLSYVFTKSIEQKIDGNVVKTFYDEDDNVVLELVGDKNSVFVNGIKKLFEKLYV